MRTLALFLIALPAVPQTAPLRLTLRDAVQMALQQNPQVQIANLNIALAESETTLARSPLLPQAALQATEREQRFNLEALMGRPFPGIPQHAGPFATFQAGPAFSMPVFDLTLWRRWRASKESEAAAMASRQTTREQITALVVSQYLAGLRATADVGAAQSRVDLAQALYNQAADLQKAGVGTGIDTLRANVELRNEQQRLISAQVTLRTAMFGLERLLNLKPDQSVELADQVKFFQTPPIEVDQSVGTALRTRPEIRALEAQERAAEEQRRAAEAERLPALRFEGNWGYQGLSPADAIPAYTYGVAVTLPILTGRRIGAETARAEIQRKRIEQQRQEQANGIALEVKTAVAQLESARNEVDVANQGVALAREEVNQARDRFQAGVANNIEVIAAQDALARANDNQIVALYRYNQARADLARSIGQMESLYAK